MLRRVAGLEWSFGVVGRVLIVCDDDAARESLEFILAGEVDRVLCAPGAEAALDIIESSTIDIIFCDPHIPGIENFDLMPQIARRVPNAPIILISTNGLDDIATETIRRNGYDYLSLPFEPGDVRLTLRRALERQQLQKRIALLDRDITRSFGDRAIIAASDGMIELLELVERAAGYRSAILILGEKGTGKEVIARAIHSQSLQREAPFVWVRCGGTPENLLEIELFGQVENVLNVGNQTEGGLFAMADTGSLFLDEISELPLGLQLKLLRAIQEEEILPVGETKAQKIDVRVIATTSRDLNHEISEGRFRQDLFDRLNDVRLEVPPLRERRPDLALLVDHFLARFSDELGKNIRGVSDEALDLLVSHPWPGNVRELENMIERAILLTESGRIEPSSLPMIVQRRARIGIDTDDSNPIEDQDYSLKRARQGFEAQFIRRALERTKGNRTHAAKILEISHRALLYKLKEYGIRD